jgi:hypothetical protein
LGVSGYVWYQSYREKGLGYVTWRFDDRRYALRAARGALVIRASPKQNVSAEGDRAIVSAKNLRNERLIWSLYVQFRGSGFRIERPDEPGARFAGNEEDDLVAMKSGAAVAPLLDALDDPDRFIAAHHCLSRYTKVMVISDLRQSDDIVLFRYNGLPVELRPLESSMYAHNPRQSGKWLKLQGDRAVKIDITQLPQIRRYWHDRFDEPLLAVPIWILTASLSVYPLFWIWRRFRAIRALRRGLCSSCGYDLRAAKERCPECGQAIPNSQSSVSPSISAQ